MNAASRHFAPHPLCYSRAHCRRSCLLDFMRPDRIVPLIIAVALFMENMDSTVIATSLPAIAGRYRHQSAGAQARRHLLSAVARDLHPGQRLDRRPLRRPHRVPRRHRRVHPRLDRLRAIGIADRFRHRAHRAGHGRRDDDASRPHGAGADHFEARAGQRHGLGDDTGVDRPGDGPAGRRFHHHLRELALDFPHQRTDRTARHRF